MSFEAYLVVAVLGVAGLFFSFEWIAPEVTALSVLILLVTTRILTPEEAFSGFSSSAVIAIGGLLVISAGLVRSGAVKWLADRLGAFAGSSHRRLLLISTIIPGVLSGAINIVATISIFIPAVLRMIRQSRLGPAGLLLPMAVSGLMGANLSLFGASHNLVVNSLLRQGTGESFGVFEFAPLGVILLVGVTLYALLLSKRVLNQKENGQAAFSRDSIHDLVTTYQLDAWIWEIQVESDSLVCCKSLEEIGIGRKYGLSVFMALRGEKQIPIEDKSFTIEPGDILAIAGRSERLQALVHEQNGLVLMGQPVTKEELTWSAFDMLEVVVPPRSEMIGRTLREKRVRHATGLTAIGLWRDNRPFRTGVYDRELAAGDAVLLFGSRNRVREFRPEPDFVWLKKPREQEAPLHLRRFAPVAAFIFIAVIVSASLNWLSIAAAALAGAIAMILLGILDTREAYRRIDWRTLMLVAGMYPVGTALQKTGAAGGLAQLILQSAGAWGAVPALAAVGLLAMILTQPMHTAVAALITTPVAIQVAAALNANPKAFAIAVILGASASFLMPVGHPAALLVRKPGAYRNLDYLKFGIVPALFVLAVIAVVVPLLWPLEG
jgi:di/tricarboxylate transporter